MQDSDQDYHNFSTPSSHRLPTISGTQAVRNAVNGSKPVSTGLPSLDDILSSTIASQKRAQHGLRRGTVTEVFGPPGVGKTTFALQTAVNTIHHEKSHVTWIDTSSLLMSSRLIQLLGSAELPNSGTDLTSNPSVLHAETIERFSHLDITSLPRLLAMFLHPLTGFPPKGTTLVILDDLSNLILTSLPRVTRNTVPQASQITPTQVRADHATKQTLSRRAQIISSLASALQAFAAAHNVAVLVTSKARISLMTGQQAFLRSALASQQWDACLATRIVLYRDTWPPEPSQSSGNNAGSNKPTEFEHWNLRYALVLKLAGKDVSTNDVGFVIEENGLREVISPPASERRTYQLPSNQGLLEPDDILDTDAQDGDESMATEQIDVLSDLDSHRSDVVQAHPAKRKAIEIADSDDDDDSSQGSVLRQDQEANVAANEPGVASESNLDFPSSQSMPTFQTAKKLRFDDHVSDGLAERSDMVAQERIAGEYSDEMLLDQAEQEAQVQLFSQAAAEMSDPLTPSDDGQWSP